MLDHQEYIYPYLIIYTICDRSGFNDRCSHQPTQPNAATLHALMPVWTLISGTSNLNSEWTGMAGLAAYVLLFLRGILLLDPIYLYLYGASLDFLTLTVNEP